MHDNHKLKGQREKIVSLVGSERQLKCASSVTSMDTVKAPCFVPGGSNLAQGIAQ